MTLEQRFEKLQDDVHSLGNQNRKLKKWMAGIAALALVAIVAGTVGVVKAGTTTFDIIKANKVYANEIRVRRPGTNSTRIKLYVTNNAAASPRIRFYDTQGRLQGSYYRRGYRAP